MWDDRKEGWPYVHNWTDTIGDADITCEVNGRWYRAVPKPYPATFSQRCHAAWEVLRGRAYAIHWPDPGDLEIAVEYINQKAKEPSN